MKFDLLKAHLSGPGGNTTGADGLTMGQANRTSNVNAAGILMDPLNFYQVSDHSISSLRRCPRKTEVKRVQYYGFKESLLPFCNILETQNRTAEPVENGVVAQFGIETGFKSFLTAISEVDYAAIPGDADDPVQDRSWMWQYCSEYGTSTLRDDKGKTGRLTIMPKDFINGVIRIIHCR